jgi:hypothetical protein
LVFMDIEGNQRDFIDISGMDEETIGKELENRGFNKYS